MADNRAHVLEYFPKLREFEIEKTWSGIMPFRKKFETKKNYEEILKSYHFRKFSSPDGPAVIGKINHAGNLYVISGQRFYIMN